MSKDFLKPILLASLSGFLLALAYPGWGFGIGSDPIGELSFLVWVGLVPLLLVFRDLVSDHDRTNIRVRFKNAFALSFTAGLIYFLLAFRWLWSVHPLNNLGVESEIASLFIILVMLLISAAGMAVFWGISGIAWGYGLRAWGNSKWHSSLVASLLATLMFVVTEYLRSWGFGILWAGSGSLFGPHWTIGNFAYSLADNSLIRWLVPHIGIYGITFLVILVNLLLAKLISRGQAANVAGVHSDTIVSKRTLRMGATILTIILILTLLPNWLMQPNKKLSSRQGGTPINFAIIQTNHPTRLIPSPQETLVNFKQELEMLKRVAKEHPKTQIVVFPEASDFFKNLALFMTSAQVETFFKNLFPKPTLVIAGGRVIESGTGLAYSRVFSLDTQDDIISFYDKRLLTPGGEFLPYPLRFLTNLFSRATVSQFGEFRELAVGQRDVSTVGFRYQFSVGTVICSEFWSPSLTAKTTQNSDIILGMSSYGIFRGNLNIVKQNLAAARLRAAENRKPMLVASNMGLSYVLDNRGNIIKILPNNAPALLTGSVYISIPK